MDHFYNKECSIFPCIVSTEIRFSETYKYQNSCQILYVLSKDKKGGTTQGKETTQGRKLIQVRTLFKERWHLDLNTGDPPLVRFFGPWDTTLSGEPH